MNDLFVLAWCSTTTAGRRQEHILWVHMCSFQEWGVTWGFGHWHLCILTAAGPLDIHIDISQMCSSAWMLPETALVFWFDSRNLLQFKLFNFKYCTQNFNLIYIFPEIATSFICIFLFVEQFSCEIASGTPILTHNLKLACILNLSLLIHIQCCIKHPFSCWINDNTPCSVWSPLLPL